MDNFVDEHLKEQYAVIDLMAGLLYDINNTVNPEQADGPWLPEGIKERITDALNTVGLLER